MTNRPILASIFDIIIIIIIITKTTFMVMSSWQSHCIVHPVHLMNVERRQAAADPRPSQTTYRLWVRLYRLPETTPTVAIYYYYSARKLILILPSHRSKAESTKLAGYIQRWFTCSQTVTHPGTNRVWRSATTLIEANALPLSQTVKRESKIV